MKFKEIVKSRFFWKHIIIMLALSIALLFVVILSLNIITRHGKEFDMPDFTGVKLDAIQSSGKYDNFEFIVVDSVYDAKLPEGQILTQDPLPLSKIKSGRKVYLTVVSNTPEYILMPDLVDLSLRQASALLETYGLRTGKLEYREDMAHNAILGMKYKGEDITKDFRLPKGAVIDLIVGKVSSEGRTHIPLLIGKTMDEARKLLIEASLNVGEEHYDSSIDPALLRVTKQSPRHTSGQTHSIGSDVDIWYQSEKEVNIDKLMKDYKADTASSTNNIESLF